MAVQPTVPVSVDGGCDMAPRRGHPQRPIAADRPGAQLAEYLRKLRHDADVTYRHMAQTVPCAHNTLSQTVDGRLTGWPSVETFLKALRAAASDGAVPADAERRARQLWEQTRARAVARRSEASATTPSATEPPAEAPSDVASAGDGVAAVGPAGEGPAAVGPAAVGPAAVGPAAVGVAGQGVAAVGVAGQGAGAVVSAATPEATVPGEASVVGHGAVSANSPLAPGDAAVDPVLAGWLRRRVARLLKRHSRG